MSAVVNDENFAKSLSDNYGVVYGLSLRMLRNEPDAEDNTQETMLKAFKYRRQFRGQSKFSSWLCQIAVNEVRQKIRRRKINSINFSSLPETGPCCLEAMFEYSSEQPSAEREVIAKELTGLLFADVSELTKNTLKEHVIDGWNQYELAARLGVSENTIRSRWLRAKKFARLKSAELGLVTV